MLSTMMTAVTACTPSLDETVDRLYNQMTLEEKIAQLHGNYLTDFFTEDGQLDTLKCEQLFLYVHSLLLFSAFSVLPPRRILFSQLPPAFSYCPVRRLSRVRPLSRYRLTARSLISIMRAISRVFR